MLCTCNLCTFEQADSVSACEMCLAKRCQVCRFFTRLPICDACGAPVRSSGPRGTPHLPKSPPPPPRSSPPRPGSWPTPTHATSPQPPQPPQAPHVAVVPFQGVVAPQRPAAQPTFFNNIHGTPASPICVDSPQSLPPSPHTVASGAATPSVVSVSSVSRGGAASPQGAPVAGTPMRGGLVGRLSLSNGTPAASGGQSGNLARAGSSSYFADDEFLAVVENARAGSLEARQNFVDMWNPEEMQQYQWASVFENLRPPPMPRPQAGPQVSTTQATTAIDAVASGFRNVVGAALGRGSTGRPSQCGVSGTNGWVVFPSHGVSAKDIQQGGIGDCWFLSVVAIVAHHQPRLIQDLFLVDLVEPPGVFAVKLWIDGMWTPFLIDGNFPVVRTGISQIELRHAKSSKSEPNALWVPLLEKAFAKAHGGYEALTGGHTTEALYALTGCPVEELSADMTFENQDEIFAQVMSLYTAKCVMSATCGSSDVAAQYAARFKVKSTHAYSLLMVGVCAATHRRMVLMRDPWGSTSAVTEDPPIARDGQPPFPAAGGGLFWMQFAEFWHTFGSIHAARTTPFRAGFAARGVMCDPMAGFIPPLENSVVVHVGKPTELHVLAAQTSQRNLDTDQPQRLARHSRDPKMQGPTPDGYFDVWILLLKVDPATNRLRVHSTSPWSCHHVTCFSSGMVDPGVYCVLPMSLQQHLVPGHPSWRSLTLNVLSDSADVVAMPTDVVERPRINALLTQYVMTHPKASIQPSKSGTWCSGSLTCHTGSIVVLQSNTRDVTAASIKSDAEYGRNGALKAVMFPSRQVDHFLPGNTGVVMGVAVVPPHRGTYQYSFGYTTSFQTIPGAAPPSANSQMPPHGSELFRPV